LGGCGGREGLRSEGHVIIGKERKKTVIKKAEQKKRRQKYELCSTKQEDWGCHHITRSQKGEGGCRLLKRKKKKL